MEMPFHPICRGLLENMPSAMAHCRMLYRKGEAGDFVFLGVNPAFEKLGLKEPLEKKATELMPGLKESNPELFELCGRVARGGEAESVETFLPPLARWFSIKVYSPRKGHFVAILDDITERRNAET
ncbi:MAG: diguanylate cyclase, partial [Elusimicrobia bacterium]|nr:diguanylate cyclase [Elusimicrobiota bacterium]